MPTEIDHAEMLNIHVKADSIRASMLKKPPMPNKMLSLYKPMHFEKLRSGDGKFVIATQKSQCFDVTNFRHVLMLGVPVTKINFGRDVEFHKLLQGKSVLTYYAPVEIFSQYIEFAKAEGNVLVGGLGLGMAPTMMLGMPKVNSITVVEIEKQIIDLVGPQIDDRIKIVHEDLFTYLMRPEIKGKYDFAYHDILYNTGESMWADNMAPLYRLTRKAGIKKMAAWGEHETRWQMISALFSRTMVEEKYSRWLPYKVFIDGVKKHLGGKPPYGPEHQEAIIELIKLYLNKVGTPRWEKTFDWDSEVCNKEKRERA